MTQAPPQQRIKLNLRNEQPQLQDLEQGTLREQERHTEQEGQRALNKVRELKEKQPQETEKLRKQEEGRIEEERLEQDRLEQERTPSRAGFIRSSPDAGPSAPIDFLPLIPTELVPALTSWLSSSSLTYAPPPVMAIPVPVVVDAARNDRDEQELIALLAVRDWIEMRINQLSEGRPN